MHESVKPDNCPFCGGEAKMMHGAPGCHFVKCTECGASSDDVAEERALAKWNRRARPPQDAKPEPVGGRDVLFFTSYCGGDNPGCTDARPCADCLAMSNVYSIPAETEGTYRRELGAVSPASPPLAVEALREALKPFAEIAEAMYVDPENGWSDEDILSIEADPDFGVFAHLKAGHFRRLRDLLKSLGGSDGR